MNRFPLNPATSDSALSTKRLSVLLLISKVALIAGTLDITYNLIFNSLRGISPVRVFKYIASGLIGPDAAARGGLASVALGIVLHYLIAFIWTSIFYAASRKFALIRKHFVISGLLYGGVVYLLMNRVVLPLSRVPHLANTMTLAARINGIIALLLCIGLTISFLFHRESSPRDMHLLGYFTSKA